MRKKSGNGAEELEEGVRRLSVIVPIFWTSTSTTLAISTPAIDTNESQQL